MIPFWTFFGATFIGKAINKMSIQSTFVILAFEPTRLAAFIEFIEGLPFLPAFARGRLTPIFAQMRASFHGDKAGIVADVRTGFVSSCRTSPLACGSHPCRDADCVVQKNILASVWDVVLLVMILWFLKSIIETTVQERMAVKGMRIAFAHNFVGLPVIRNLCDV